MSIPNHIVTGGTGAFVSAGSATPGQISIANVQPLIDIIAADGTAMKRVTVTVNAPLTGATPDTIHLWNDDPDSSGGTLASDGTVSADGTIPSVGLFSPNDVGAFAWLGNASQDFTFDIAAPSSPQYDRVYASAQSKSFSPHPVQYGLTGATPSFQYTVNPTSTQSGTEYAPNVSGLALASALPSGWTTNPNIAINAFGDQEWQVAISFVYPTGDTRFSQLAGVNAELQYAGQQHYIGDLTADRNPLYVTPPKTVLPGTTSYVIELISFDQNGNSNTLVPGVTPALAFTVTRLSGVAGLEQTSIPTNVTWSVGSFVAGDGTKDIDVVVHGTDPSNDPTFGGYALFYQRPGDTVPVEVRPPARSRILPLEWVGGNPTTSQSWTFSLVSLDTNNHLNTIVGGVTPQDTVTVGGSSLLDISQAAPGTFSGTHFDTSGASFHIKAGGVGTAELTTSSIDVGGSGSKPIRFRVFDSLGTQIAWIGDDTANSGYVSGWFKQFRVGGTGPSTAIIVADSSGNVSITGASFSVTGSGITVTIDGTNYVKVASASSSCTMGAASFGSTNAAGTLAFAASASSLTLNNTNSGSQSAVKIGCGTGNDPFMNLVDSAGTIYFEIRPSNSVASTATAGIQTLPTNPFGFLVVTINGVLKKIPYYSN